MKKIRKKDKGFTLIELLATVAIASVITAIGVFAVQKIIKTSETKKQEISIKNIVKSASQYTEEFKTLDKYWTKVKDGEEQPNIEYACTTVGMLINKGFLKKDVVGLEIEIDGKKETIKDTTSIKIDRDINTKVFNSEDVIFDSTECSETANIDLNFEVKGDNSNCDSYQNEECPYNKWFNKVVTIKINAISVDKIDSADYSIKDENNNHKAINELEIYNEKTSNWNIKVGDQGREINVCVKIWDTNGNDVGYFCLDDKFYNMDKDAPSVPDLELIKDVNYKLVSHNSSDKNDLTNSDNLFYYLSENGEPLTKGEATYEIPNSLKIEGGKEVSSYTIDEAGNKSKTKTGKLTISTAQNGNASTETNYFCSLDTSKAYNSEADATNNCTKIENGTVSSKKIYLCSLKNTTYDSKTAATDDCYKIENGTVTSGITYSCPNGGTLTGTKCTKTTIDTQKVTGSGKYTLKCEDDKKWYDQGDYNFTNKNCPPGYYKVNYYCSGCSGCGTTCSTVGATKIQTESCYNICEKEIPSTYNATPTTKYYCSYTGNTSYTREADAKNACVKTTNGTVSSTTKYFCSLNMSTSYTTENNAKNNCSKKTTGNVSSTEKYYCDLFNGQEFSSLTEAQNKCKDQCIDGGDYHSNSCYSFKEKEV